MADETKTPEELRALATTIVEQNRFMTLATADTGGRPWASPVWYAPSGELELYWASSPEARHSRNLSDRPQLAVVIFDPHEVGGWNAVYLSATAEELTDVDDAVEIYSARSEAQGFKRWVRDDLVAPAKHRLYRAVVSERFVLDTHDRRIPVGL